MHAVAALLLAAAAFPQDADRAARDLVHAEELFARGKYSASLKAYAKLAKKHDGTPEAMEAARRSAPNGLLGWAPLVESGPSTNRIDVVVMGDGYTLNKQDDFEKISEVVPRLFERHTVLGEYFAYHNFTRAHLVSKDDGYDAFGREYDTPLDGRDSGAAQGQVAVDHGKVHDFLGDLPDQDGLAVVYVKMGSLGTGGGGVAVVGGRSDTTLIHEWGHAFGGLSDEYSTDTGHRGSVRSNINVSNTDDLTQVPWRHWIDARVPGVGASEGADGRFRGAWKPMTSGCTMSNGMAFCRICREAMVLRVYSIVDPIDGCTPDAHPRTGRESLEGETIFEVTLLRPKKHPLEVRWWVLPEAQAPGDPVSSYRGWGRSGDRRSRGPLVPIEAKPRRTAKTAKGHDRFRFTPSDFGPGRYRIVCRVNDTTKFGGDRWPWVLKDEHGVLESERAWWVTIPPK